MGVNGGSGLSANNVWGFKGTSVEHWNGHAWTATSVAALLPEKVPPPAPQISNPMVTGIYAQSPASVYAIGNGYLQGHGGPVVVLRYDGHKWTRVARSGALGVGTTPVQQISPDGHGGIWLPMPAPFGGGPGQGVAHYSAGKLTVMALPGGISRTELWSVALVPGTRQLIGGGFTHAPDNVGKNVAAVLFQYS